MIQKLQKLDEKMEEEKVQENIEEKATKENTKRRNSKGKTSNGKIEEKTEKPTELSEATETIGVSGGMFKSSESSTGSGSASDNLTGIGQLGSEVSSTTKDRDSPPNGPKENAGKVKETEAVQSICRSCGQWGLSDQMVDPCECKNANQWIHFNCLAKQMESTKELAKCSVCKANYKTDRFRLIKRPKSCLAYFRQSTTNFAYLVEIPLSLGFICFLLALGLIQYDQSYKIVYLKWSIILVFLIILIILNHIVLFVTNIYQLANRVRRFQATNFHIVVEARQ